MLWLPGQIPCDVYCPVLDEINLNLIEYTYLCLNAFIVTLRFQFKTSFAFVYQDKIMCVVK